MPISSLKYSQRTKNKTPNPNIRISAQWYCHYAEEIKDPIKMMKGLEIVNNWDTKKTHHFALRLGQVWAFFQTFKSTLS